MMRKKCILFGISWLLFMALSAFGQQTIHAEGAESDPVAFTNGTYDAVLSAWETQGLPDTSGQSAMVLSTAFTEGNLVGLASSYGYHGSAIAFNDLGIASAEVIVPLTGLYTINLDFYSESANYLDLEMQIEVNGETPFSEASQIILYKHWRQTTPFSTDRYGNDFYGTTEQQFEWINQPLYDPMGLYLEPLAFLLEAGNNTLTFTRTRGEFILGDLLISGVESRVDYSDYLGSNTMVDSAVLDVYEAEIPDGKTASSIQAAISRDALVTPFEVRTLKLNVLSGASFQSLRDQVSYDILVATAGYYRLSFKLLQNTQTNGIVFRSLWINGNIPFAEAGALPIEYNTKWQNYTPSDSDGQPYLFYLEAGVNTISLAVALHPYRELYRTVETVLAELNDLTLEITKLTGNQIDEDRDWNILDFMPEVDVDLIQMADALEAGRVWLETLSVTEKSSEIGSSLKIAIRNLRFLAEKPNEIPKNIALLTTSSSSVASTLGSVSASLLSSPISIDKFYVHTMVELPKANAGFFVNLWLGIRRFFLSFFEASYVDEANEFELEIWVNRSKQYVDLIQKMADDSFTTATGIPVKVSIMASEGKLILANSANQNPDVAMGIASWMPYDLGIRGALYDLSRFQTDPEFGATLGLFSEQALIPMIYDDMLFGLPDTENFYVMYYRADILEALDLEVPNTWDDVVQMMPVLRRFGMNFYLPLSSATSLKAFDSTLPFLFQYGSDVYAQDGFSADLDNPESVAAMQMMTELYTIYSMDETVSSFYNSFRLGTSPIGIGDFGMYVTLLNAAPDIQGLWKIAVMPGVEQNGIVDRSAPGAMTANAIFEKTDKAEEAWEFLKWWSSTAIQTQFQSLLLSTLGKEYLWNSANVEAFAGFGYNESDLAVILDQWDWLRELPKVPGSYQVELEISNIWNSVVLDRENLRVRLNDALVTMDKEIRKKMAEFGYMDKNGVILKPYKVASVELIRAWKDGEGDE